MMPTFLYQVFQKKERAHSPGCDKNMPGCLIAMGRINRPSLMIYGGTIKAGVSCHKEPLDIVSAFQSYGAFLSGKITEEERQDIVQNACPGAGACGGMYTANTSISILLLTSSGISD